jgi:hypothetical protein
MKKIIISLSLVILLVGCKATSDISVKPIRIQSTINASEYNEFASKYLERPTWVSYAEYQTIPNRLYIQFDAYNALESSRLFFMQDRVETYIALIDKYSDWEAKASSRGDILEQKELGFVDGVAGVKLKFSFYSGSSTNHYLIIEEGLLGSYNFAMVFDKSNVQELKTLFEDFVAGKIKVTNEAEYL